MQKITAIKHEKSTGKVKELLDGVNAKLGFVPNMMATMASSPAVLEGYLNFSGALGSSLNAKLREQIALTVAEINGCRYCASAHSAIGKMSGLDEHSVEDARRASSHDAKTDAALKFAKASSSVAEKFPKAILKPSNQQVSTKKKSAKSSQMLR